MEVISAYFCREHKICQRRRLPHSPPAWALTAGGRAPLVPISASKCYTCCHTWLELAYSSSMISAFAKLVLGATLLLLMLCICSDRAESTSAFHDTVAAGVPPLAPPPDAGMTERFFFDFFPALWRWLNTYTPAVWRTVQPPHIVRACPEIDMQLPLVGGKGRSFMLRNPTLLPFQILGAAVGLSGAWSLSKEPSDQQQQQQRKRRDLRAHGAPTTYYWAASLLFFALMNFSSIACHALMSDRSPAWEWAGVVDVVFTGCSSLCLLYQQAAIWWALPPRQRQRRGQSQRGAGRDSSPPPAPPRLLHPPADAAGARALCLHTLLAALLVGFGGHLLRVPWTNELLYIGTTLVAAKAVALVHWSARHTATPRQHAFYVVGLAGVGCMLGALPADRFLCAAFGPAFGTVHLLFLGCDVAFWGLYGFVTGRPLGLPDRAHSD